MSMDKAEAGAELAVRRWVHMLLLRKPIGRARIAVGVSSDSHRVVPIGQVKWSRRASMPMPGVPSTKTNLRTFSVAKIGGYTGKFSNAEIPCGGSGRCMLLLREVVDVRLIMFIPDDIGPHEGVPV